jgi:hypothetical protein
MHDCTDAGVRATHDCMDLCPRGYAGGTSLGMDEVEFCLEQRTESNAGAVTEETKPRSNYRTK